MKLSTPDREQIRRFYNRLGARYDWFSAYEALAKERALDELALRPGLRVLNLGVGTGQEHLEICRQIGTAGFACGVDLSQVMLRISQRRTQAPHCQADAKDIPLCDQSFERIFAAYILDLLAEQDIPLVLAEARRLLRPTGRLVIAAMTEGVDKASKTLMGAWKLTYKLSPIFLGGCRPLELKEQVTAAGFSPVTRQVIVQLGMPSEIITAIRPG